MPLGILLATIAAFFVHGALGLEPATVALAGATALLLTGVAPLDETLSGIDWPTLFFFGGLFVMVGGLEHVGFIDAIAQTTKDLTAGSRSGGAVWHPRYRRRGSAFVDNIPFTAAMIPVVEQLNEGNDDSYWWALVAWRVLRWQRHHHRRGRKRRLSGRRRTSRRAHHVPSVPRMGRPGDAAVPRHRSRLLWAVHL